MRRRVDREKMRKRLGPQELILWPPRELLMDGSAEDLQRWVEEQVRRARLRAPTGMRCMVERRVVQPSLLDREPEFPVQLRIYCAPRHRERLADELPGSTRH
jgi:hypothetical protein